MRLALALVVVIVLGAVAVARADVTIALLPLDADPQLEIYGQPFANEVAKALRSDFHVVVVGPRMAVPADVTLIVDGTIHAEKTDKKREAITLSLRIRNPRDGATLDTVTSAAASIAAIDKVVVDVTAKLLPVLRAQLEAIAARPPAPPVPVAPPAPSSAPQRPMLVAIKPGAPATEVLRAALVTSLDQLVTAANRTPTPIEPSLLAGKGAAKSVKDKGTDLGIVLELEGYHATTCSTVPCARARVHVRLADAVGVLFDRTLVTDTVLGDKGMSDAALAARVAREVFEILRPNFKRAVPAWR